MLGESLMRIAVIGAGAMGSLFAARLAEQGHAISLIEVSAALIDAIRIHGLRTTGLFGAQAYKIPVGPADSYRESFDLLIVFTKGMHTMAAIDAAKHLINEQTWALTVQNGIGNVEAIETVIPRSRITMGITNWPSTLVEAGLINVPGSGEIKVWAADKNASDNVHAICAALTEAGLNCALDPAVEVAIWEKLAFNAALNSLAAVSGLTVGEMGDRDESRSIIFAIVEETVAVATAKGLQVNSSRIRYSVEHAFANHRQHMPSMLQDRLAGRPMEVSSIAGAVSDAGRALAVPTPVTSAFASLLTLLDGVALQAQ